jgi:hypothetical protein
MKNKAFLIAVMFAVGFFMVNAQPVSKGDKIFNASLGLGSTLYSGSFYKGQIPPVSASLEYLVMDDLIDGNGAVGLGGYIGFSSYKWEYQGWGWKYTNIILGPRGTFHYNFIENLDTYTGLLIGYNVVTSKEFGNSVPGYNYSASSGGLIWAWYAGGRYFFSDKLAGLVELGYGIAYLNIGIALKL